MLTIKNLVSGSNLSEEDQKRILQYTQYLIEQEESKNLGKAYGWLKKQYTMQQLEIKELHKEIEAMKEVF